VFEISVGIKGRLIVPEYSGALSDLSAVGSHWENLKGNSAVIIACPTFSPSPER
jgi:hypothetical protein